METLKDDNGWVRVVGEKAEAAPPRPEPQEVPAVVRRSEDEGVLRDQGTEWATAEECEELRVWSGALPAIVYAPARPWNGRRLTTVERAMARMQYRLHGAQAAYEWLSENAK